MLKRSRALLALPLILVLTTLACNLTLPPIGVTIGGQAAPSNTPAVVATEILPADTATPTPEPSVTPTPTITPTATPEPPRAQLTENTNCRTGPLSVYDLISTYITGKTLDILGRTADQTYWYVSDPLEPGTECWLWGRYAQVSGAVDTVPVFTPPPTPTPSFVWGGSWNVSVRNANGTMSLSQSGSSISGTLTLEGLSYQIAASTSDGGRQANGDVLQNGNAVVDFTWFMLDNTDQFQGSYEQGQNTYPWCGYRDGAGYPSPCMWP